MARNRVNFNLSTVDRQLSRLEEKILSLRKPQEQPPVLVIVFHSYSDGTVPDVTDRDLNEWELLKDSTDTICVSAIEEYRLRQGLDHDIPEAPQGERIPLECFFSWLYTQEQKLYKNEQEQTQLLEQ